jgi:hypothetical protein
MISNMKIDAALADAPNMDAASDQADGKPYDLAEHYWLARPSYSEEFAQECIDRFTRHAEMWRLSATPLTSAMWQAYRVYHGLVDGTDEPVVSLTEAGEDGEFLKLFVNHFRGLVRHQVALMTADRLVWDVQARTSDSEAMKQVSLAQNLCDYAMDAKGFSPALRECAEYMRVLASGYIAQGWDPNAGIDGKGDIWRTTLAPWECVHEDVRDYDDATWHLFLRWESRWDWVAHFAKDDPAKAEKIANYDPGEEFVCGVRTRPADGGVDNDRIPLLYLYANPTRACPAGRMAIIAGGGEEFILVDTALPYGQEAPIRRMCSATFLGTSTPIGNSWSMLPIQEAYNAVISVIMTRIDLFGVPNIFSQDGVEFEAGDMGGANSLKVPPGAELPQASDMLQVPNALPKFGEGLETSMEKLSGINSVTRGNPTENITSGSMAALVQAMAQQFNSSDEAAYITCVEKVATDTIGIYQRMATEPQLISIAGSDERYSVRQFVGEDLDQVMRIKVKVGNALSRNIAGRSEIANNLLDRGAIQDPREYLEVLHTGNLTPVFSGPVNEMLLVRSENDALVRGEDPPVSMWDNDELHIREHRCQLDTGARYEPELSTRINKHLMAHMDSWGKKSRETPDVCVAIGQNPLPGAAAAGNAAMQMQGGAPTPMQPGSPPQKTPHAAPPQKGKPGPVAAPGGQQQSRAEPKLPAPAEAPGGPQ